MLLRGCTEEPDVNFDAWTIFAHGEHEGSLANGAPLATNGVPDSNWNGAPSAETGVTGNATSARDSYENGVQERVLNCMPLATNVEPISNFVGMRQAGSVNRNEQPTSDRNPISNQNPEPKQQLQYGTFNNCTFHFG